MRNELSDTVAPHTSRGRVLLIDDEAQLRRSLGRILRKAGFEVDELAEGDSVTATVAASEYDVVMSDIMLPGISGIEVLQAVRNQDPDMPVVLMTAGGDLTSAVRAVEYGALRYLEKPVDPSQLSRIAEDAVQARRTAKVQRRALEMYGTALEKEAGREGLRARFDRALASLHMAYQPIVRWSDRSVYSYEALVRNEEPSLRRPDFLFEAAEELDALPEIGRKIRATIAKTLETAEVEVPIFVNLHPKDLEDDELLSAESPLSKFASRIVLEITERAALESISDVTERLATLRRLGYRLAIDDLGAGYAGLSALAQLQPDVVKLDMSLVRGIDKHPTKQKMVRSMAHLCTELGMLVVSEGVETAQERDTLVSLGCDLLQGYYFAKPAPPFPTASFGVA